jgi:hypothetical protein
MRQLASKNFGTRPLASASIKLTLTAVARARGSAGSAANKHQIKLKRDNQMV